MTESVEPTNPADLRPTLPMATRWSWPRIAALTHRLSGLTLALFLPLHFLALGLALQADEFSEFVAWTDNYFVKLSEIVVVSALAIHLTGGIRLLAVEFLSLDARDAYFIGLAAAFATAFSLLFLLGLFS